MPVKAHTRTLFAWILLPFAALAAFAGVGLRGPAQNTAEASSEGHAAATLPTPPKISLVDIAERAGLSALTVDGGQQVKKYIVESAGSGVAIVDYDNDGWPDIFLVNGSTLEGFPKGQEPTSHLYHNNRDGTFTDVTRSAGAALTGWGQGVCAGDYDNDGHTDLFVTFWGHNVLLHNNGDGTFRDDTRKAGLWRDEPSWSTGCSFVDYDRDGKLDLFIAHYVDFDAGQLKNGQNASGCFWMGLPVFCGPRGLKGTRSELYHNNGDGTFSDVSDKSGVAHTGSYYCFTALTADFDNNGWPDVYVACDSSPSMFFRNDKDGTFTESALTAGVAYNEDGHVQSGMGADAGDYDGDGWLDIVKTNFSEDTATLYRNNGDGTFVDATLRSGLGRATQFLGWGTLFVDIDDDGWPDIVMANGHVYPEIEGRNLESQFRERKEIYWNRHDGKFQDVSLDAGPGATAPRNSHGLAAGDLNNDGSIELVVNNSYDPPSVLKNFGDRGNWILLKLVGTKSNRDAIGARVTLLSAGHPQIQEVRSGGSYISQSDFRLHFGLGKATRVDSIEVRWPSGLIQKFSDLMANQSLELREGAGIQPARRK